MAYNSRNWESGKTPLSKENLKAMDDAIVENSKSIEDVLAEIQSLIKAFESDSEFTYYPTAPTSSSTGKVGDFWFASTTQKLYLCVAVFGGVYTWKDFAEFSTLSDAQISAVVEIYILEHQEELADMLTPTETVPSPNLININDTESYPFGTSETQAVKGLYSWVDSEGYINIKGTATENCTLYLMFADGNTTFEAGTYYICFDGILRAGSDGVNILFNDTVTWLQTNDANPKATITLTESLTVKKFDLNFNSGATVDFRGHCWMTKDEPFDFYVPKDGSYKVPITPIKKEDFEKLKDHNILGIFDSIGGVGDSLMSGYINPTSDDVGSDTTCYDKSWLSQIKKILGVDITHYSYQGATAKNWLENYNEFYDKIIETPHEAYLLALGTNDSSDWAGYDIGTIADMGTDTESFCGYYSKVIARIREANPNAPIFMFSMYWTGFEAYNEAIQAISELTENAYYIDITDMDEMYSVYRQGYHFNAIGYYYIAKSIIERVSNVIVENAQDFANLGISV